MTAYWHWKRRLTVDEVLCMGCFRRDCEDFAGGRRRDSGHSGVRSVTRFAASPLETRVPISAPLPATHAPSFVDISRPCSGPRRLYPSVALGFSSLVGRLTNPINLEVSWTCLVTPFLIACIGDHGLDARHECPNLSVCQGDEGDEECGEHRYLLAFAQKRRIYALHVHG